MPPRNTPARARPRAVTLLARFARRVLHVVAFLLLLVVALILPVPMFGRPPRYEHAGRKNEPTEVERKR